MVSRLWEKMGQVFASKWHSQVGAPMQDEQPTEMFLAWCQATERLTDNQWLEGIAAVERKIIADLGNDREPWPPTAPVFAAMARKQTAAAGLSALSYQPHPNVIEAEKRKKKLALESDSFKAKKKSNGNAAISEIRKMLKG